MRTFRNCDVERFEIQTGDIKTPPNRASPVWILLCCLQDDELLKHRSQCLHAKGFTPAWVRSCRLQYISFLQPLLQCLHEYGFIPVLVRSCSLWADTWSNNWHSFACFGIVVAISITAVFDWLLWDAKHKNSLALAWKFDLISFEGIWSTLLSRSTFLPIHNEMTNTISH